jgi:pyruvate dehydrogenase E2 component (dihydrolipoamide acetyltransferase)
LSELAQRRRDLVERAKAGQSRTEDLVGGSFTLSNLGTLDVDQFEAIINPPQSGILAVGAIKPRPFVVDEQLSMCKTVFLTLSVDHRVIDGAEAGRFLQHLVQFIEHPLLLCVQ